MNFFQTIFKMLSETEDDEDCSSHETFISSVPRHEQTSKSQVFLKIRPAYPPVLADEQNDIYVVEDSNTLSLNQPNPNDSARRSKLTKPGNNVSKKKFTFSKIFNQETSQSTFFSETILPIIVDSFNNQSSTIISYGTADAGKTHTLYGSMTSPGAIPRSIGFIFFSINCTLAPWYKVDRFGGVINLQEDERNRECDIREDLLISRSIDKSMCTEVYKMIEQLESKNNRTLFNDSMYSVWISFVEIYNDTIFDLLETDEEGKNVQLKLVTDKLGVPSIQGIRSICATTGLEAYQILIAGQSRLSTVLTSSYRSSRSHSIFTITLLKYEKDSAPSEVKMTSISYWDLAGTGRIQKIVSNNKQFQESRSINASLLALGRCLKVISRGHSRHSAGPFRDSKLTRLFQRSLCVEENIIFLININPTLQLFAETQNVLNFASMVMKLIMEFSKEDKKIIEPSSTILTPKVSETQRPKSAKTSREQRIEDLLSRNKQLVSELKKLKNNKLKEEFEFRREIADYYVKQLNKLEDNWKSRMIIMEREKENLLKFSVNRVESFYKGKLGECTFRKRKRTDRGDIEDVDVEVFDPEQSQFSSRNLSSKKSLESMQNEHEHIPKNHQALELSLLKESLKKFAEAIDVSNGKSEDKIELDSMDIEKYYAGNNCNEETLSHLLTIQQLVKKSIIPQNLPGASQRNGATSQKKIQCNVENTVITQFCKEIKSLLDVSSVQVPEIDDSLDSLEGFDSHPRKDSNLSNILSRLKEFFIDNISKITKFEAENTAKSNDIKCLQDTVKQLEKEILEITMEFRESECIRLSLLKEIDNLRLELNSKEFLKNVDSDGFQLQNSTHHHTSQEILLGDTPSSLNNDSQLSSLGSDLEKAERSATRLSCGSSRNDSGLASSIDCMNVKTTENQACQTNFPQKKEEDMIFQKRLTELKLDYDCMKAQHSEESLKVAELSKELEHIKDSMTRLKENTFTKERLIDEYKKKLIASDLEIDRLNNENFKMEMKHTQLTEKLQSACKEYERNLIESQVKLKVQEESENRAAKYLEDYWKKSVNLGSELSMAYSQLEKSTIKCFKEHIVKIDKLEKELNTKIVTENELEEKIAAYEKNLVGIDKITEKINDYSNMFDSIEKEKSELRRLVQERIENQSEIEQQVQKLLLRVEERDNEVLFLKSELGAVIKINLTNGRRAKDLGKEAAKLMEKICTMKQDIVQSEEARRELEKNYNKEIDNLRTRLTVFEENADILNMISDTNENRQSEVEELKIKLAEKERELDFLKKNRNATIQRYESLVRQLQDTLKTNHHKHKLKKFFPQKQKYFFYDSKEGSIRHAHCSEPQILDWKLISDGNNHQLDSCNLYNSTQSIESSGTISSREESSRTVTDVGGKFSEVKKRTRVNHYVPCKDSDPLDSYETPVGVDLLKNNCSQDRKSDVRRKFFFQ